MMLRAAPVSIAALSYRSVMWLLPLALLAACGDEEETTTPETSDTSAEADALADSGGTADSGADAGTDAEPEVPEGPQPAAPKVYTGGDCPEFEAGTNTFLSAGVERQVDLYLPAVPEGAALTFAWHGAGDSASNLARLIGAQGIADANDTIVAVPWAAEAGISFSWAILSADDKEPDTVVFDDLLACLDEQYDIANEYVYTTGFSAGGLWSTWLVLTRSEYLAAATIFSGGVSDLTAPYQTPVNTRIPLVLTHGGPSDQVFVNFADAQEAFADALAADGHTVFICNHGRGHTIPAEGRSLFLPFMYANRFGEVNERFTGGVPENWPEWCEQRLAE
jgi:predicted esterase